MGGGFPYLLWFVHPYHQVIAYDFGSLVGDFGGTMGLFIGFSFLSLWDGLGDFANFVKQKLFWKFYLYLYFELVNKLIHIAICSKSEKVGFAGMTTINLQKITSKSDIDIFGAPKHTIEPLSCHRIESLTMEHNIDNLNTILHPFNNIQRVTYSILGLSDPKLKHF